MARKKKKSRRKRDYICSDRRTAHYQTLEQNYMPYAMSVIVSRAIPEIDGLKPAHRKLFVHNVYNGTFWEENLQNRLT